jgi:hypothetical protein
LNELVAVDDTFAPDGFEIGNGFSATASRAELSAAFNFSTRWREVTSMSRNLGIHPAEEQVAHLFSWPASP